MVCLKMLGAKQGTHWYHFNDLSLCDCGSPKADALTFELLGLVNIKYSVV